MWRKSFICLQLVLLLSLGRLVCCQDEELSKKVDREGQQTDTDDLEETNSEKTDESTSEDEEDHLPREDPHRDPSLCEVCKFLTTEVKGRLSDTAKFEVLETGYGLETKKKKDYRKSELRLIEVINDPHVCDKILEYNVHAERKGSLRFAKGRSQTMETLHNLVHKGVNVELGIPYEMWDTPSSGVTEMQRQCFMIVENYEEQIEDWYWNFQDIDFTAFLCRDRVLKEDEQQCLSEVWSEEAYKKQLAKEKKERDKLYAERKKKEKEREKEMLKGETGDMNDRRRPNKDEKKHFDKNNKRPDVDKKHRDGKKPSPSDKRPDMRGQTHFDPNDRRFFDENGRKLDIDETRHPAMEDRDEHRDGKRPSPRDKRPDMRGQTHFDPNDRRFFDENGRKLDKDEIRHPAMEDRDEYRDGKRPSSRDKRPDMRGQTHFDPNDRRFFDENGRKLDIDETRHPAMEDRDEL